MKKTLILSTAMLLHATTLSSLFEAIKKAPDTQINNLMVKEMKITKKSVTGKLFPTVNLFASAEHFSNPYNLKPQPPTVAAQIARRRGGYWFSQNIQKIGFNISMPIFVKELYDNEKKLNYLVNAMKYKAKINLLKREAILITLISKLNYLYALKNALVQKQNSIQTTYNAIKVGVQVGRIPKFKLLRLKDALNQIKINLTNINAHIDDIKAQIYKLTKIKIHKPIKILVASNIQKNGFLALKPLEENLKSSNINLKINKDAYLPKIILQAKGYRAFGKAYNNKQNLALNFAGIGIYLKWTIFNKSQNANIEKSEIQNIKNSLLIQKTLKDLTAEVMKINSSLKEIKKAIVLAENSIGLKKELLKSATTAFKLNTMTVDEYLGYEDDLANAKAKLASLIAEKNSLLANLAFIYGNNLERIFK